jgi:hypothetical protein
MPGAIRIALAAPPQTPIDEFAVCRAQPQPFLDELTALRQDLFSSFDRQVREQLGMGCVAAALRKCGHDVRALDCSAEMLGAMGAAETIRRRQPSWIGISVSSPLQGAGAAQLCRTLRDIGVAAHISLGGAVASVNYAEFLRSIPGADSVIVGEAEWSSKALVDRLAQSGEWRGIPGVASRVETGIRYSPRENHQDLNDLPFPDRDTLEALHRRNQAVSVISMFAGRRCIAGCRACEAQAPFRYRSPKQMAEELDVLVTRFGAKRFQYIDQEFFGPQDSSGRVVHFANALIAGGSDMEIAVASHAAYIREDEILRMKQAGLRRVILNLGTPSERGLEPSEEARRALAITRAIAVCRAAGLEIEPSMFLITESTGREHIARNLALVRKHSLHVCRDPTALLNSLEPVPSAEARRALACEFVDGEFKVRLEPGLPDASIQAIWNRLRTACVQLRERAQAQAPMLASTLWKAARAGRDANSRDQLRCLQAWRANLGELVLNLISAAIEAPSKTDLAALLQRISSEYDQRFLGASFDEAARIARQNAPSMLN